MDITFACESCGQSVVIDEAGAGLATQCPKCGQPLTVPRRPSETKQCPFCAETVKAEAIVCRYCGRDLQKFGQTTPKQTTPVVVAARSGVSDGFRIGIGIVFAFVVIGILICVFWGIGGIASLGGRTGEAQKSAARADIKEFSQELSLFEMDCGSYPTTEKGLQALVVQPPNCTNWKGPYIESGRIKDDPWGKKYIYKCPGEKLPHSFDLYSLGPDKIEGTDDDIGNWQ